MVDAKEQEGTGSMTHDNVTTWVTSVQYLQGLAGGVEGRGIMIAVVVCG